MIADSADASPEQKRNVKPPNGKQGYVPLDEEKEGGNYPWDTFKETSTDNLSSSDIRLWKTIHKVTKVIFIVILFFIVLSTAVVHKSTLFLLLANISPPNPTRNSSLKTSMYHFQYDSIETSATYIWSVVLVVISPYIFTTISSVWSLLFKKHAPLECTPLLLSILVESLHSVGLCFFIFGLLPNLDPIAGLLFCLNVVSIPAVLKLIYLEDSRNSKAKAVKRILAIVGLAATLTSMALWVYYLYKLDTEWQKDRPGLLVISILSPLLVSVVWWDNFIPQKPGKYLKCLSQMKEKIRDMRTKIYAIVSIWKTIVTLCMVTFIYGTGCNDSTSCLWVLYGTTHESLPSMDGLNNDTSQLQLNATLDSWILGPTSLVVDLVHGTCSRHMPMYIAVVNIITGLVCFRCCVAANKILAQIPGFSLPLVLSTPTTLLFMVTLYASQDMRISDTCSLPFPRWTSGIQYDWTMITASILGFIAIVAVTSHIWIHSQERMQRGDRMFMRPMYCGLFLDQSMILNRRRTEKPGDKDTVSEDNSEIEPEETPKIYLCATMWHENDNEMTQILKSLFRLDIDQFDHWAKHRLEANPDYYEFEAHIFFDDAYENKDGARQINEYVKRLFVKMEDAHRSVYGTAEDRKLEPPLRLDTPYGGRLVWTLPFDNRLVVHLKDKERIRHRKRWSQVMYMYYLLSYKRRTNQSDKNTFILALDGDVDFQPSALKLLVDRVKRNPNVGAACGRILPIGSGPMVWYQKFEYAVSHWLQKATEHTIGCVLCSPGCFSLFRGSHLMADNVMKRYTTPPTEARHYVQYDQGEDRWLCTLLLQQGYRVEYCAASDALTYAPEGFYEFYNQRRRWTPSTMANILDLLLDFKNVTKLNNDISLLYIGYQMLLMVSSILTPGTIFLMILGAINMAYPSLSLYWALTLNLIPVAIFIIFCFLAKPNTQLAYAAILSTVYSLVMMLVIVGLIKQAADNGFCSVTTVFLCFVVGVFVIAAFVHPKELWCILHGFLYFLAIPSMSMLLMLYSIGNLHVVSWGTRETAKPVSEQNPSTNSSASKNSNVKEWLTNFGVARESEYMFSVGNLLRCICCPNDTRNDTDVKLQTLLERFDALESTLSNKDARPHVPNDQISKDNESPRSEVKSINSDEQDIESSDRRSLQNLVRAENVKGKRRKIKESEKVFWEQLIKKYLFPINEDKAHQEKTQHDLIELRNKVCLFFILVNALFVTIVFSLQQVNLDSGGSISKELPCANGNHGGSFEPISMAFTGVFGILLFIQLICMLVHRISTFLQICSITEVSEKHHDEEKKIQENITKIKNFGSKNSATADLGDFEDYEETTDTDSGVEEEGQQLIDDSRRQKTKYNGRRGQFKRTLKLLMKEPVSGNDRRVKSVVFEDEVLRKSCIGIDKDIINDMVHLAQDKGFQKTIRRRGKEIAEQAKKRTIKNARTAPLMPSNASPYENVVHLQGLPSNKKEIHIDMSSFNEKF
ncbi:chitin synthase chs-2-like [Mercenaria mercenaria]|uniref:chitin synthase chs-2-like n=1 Tax=Mercenaria mercenaria TaxID=6596 RepID=UPI00234E9558|nr:chitin synthase chs-2-like [Mercenaria mercenaria]